MGRPKDPFWRHVTVESGQGQNVRWRCRFCMEKYSGGASRIKAHLAGITHEGIKVCPIVDRHTKEAAKHAWTSQQEKKEEEVLNQLLCMRLVHMTELGEMRRQLLKSDSDSV